ncbi:hypothetical protein NPIL_208601, partial [Nephila pilipes]
LVTKHIDEPDYVNTLMLQLVQKLVEDQHRVMQSHLILNHHIGFTI